MSNQTSDMYLAATLVSYGAEIEDVDKSDPKRQVFIFKDIPQYVWVSSGTNVYSKRVSDINEIKALIASEKLMYPPNFIHSIKSVRSYFYSD